MKDIGTNHLNCYSINKAHSNFWDIVSLQTAVTFRFTERELQVFLSNKVARLIGVLPYIAKCDEPERTALAHLAVYVLAIRGGRLVFDHTQADNLDVFARLRLGMSFKAGNTNIIQHGMSLLGLIMLCNYYRDMTKDRLYYLYNPLNVEAWNYEKKKSFLIKKIKKSRSILIDNVLSIEDAMSIPWY